MDFKQEALKEIEKVSDKLANIAERQVLNAEFRLLSELLEYFPKGSQHKAAIVIDKKMDAILDKIEKLK